MPFGLTNAVFQSLLNDVLQDMLNRHMFVYLDDILIFSKSPAEHAHHIQAVLQCLLENLLFIKAEKYEFHAPSVSFLGYIVAQGSIQMDRAKVSAVSSRPVPDSCNVLSQRMTTDQRPHLCTFFSRCLSPTERNYISNRELHPSDSLRSCCLDVGGRRADKIGHRGATRT